MLGTYNSHATLSVISGECHSENLKFAPITVRAIVIITPGQKRVLGTKEPLVVIQRRHSREVCGGKGRIGMELDSTPGLYQWRGVQETKAIAGTPLSRVHSELCTDGR
jgi:hypothetical protein